MTYNKGYRWDFWLVQYAGLLTYVKLAQSHLIGYMSGDKLTSEDFALFFAVKLAELCCFVPVGQHT